ncbi:BTB/POZ and MATH domain-containing protein 2-like [Panicum virgatum]|uniref:Uncharacterized protein n=1 Tax=Panicum virgatum TaxID=38727 RepID=A0A8T0PWZ0_PANVG|nr:BTB/POZ and MATH domain-containing protein 2-like [Panicum virgatum]KAG2563466.1 hypothetical protein PVAP13_8KG277800 [Panicum virgatum]
MPISASSPTTGGGGGGGGGGSTSTIVSEITSGWHELRVPGYAATKGGVGKFINSAAFVVGGHSWYIRYYPDGNNDKSAGWVSVYLYLDQPAAAAVDGGDVKARYKLSLIADDGEDLSSRTSGYSFWGPGKPRGYCQFIKGADMEASLRGHGFRIRCDVTVVKETCVDPTAAATAEALAVPPPELDRHLGALLDGEVGGDVAFDVGGERITAHRCVLAARSPVLMAALFGPMREDAAATGSIRVGDVEPRVFKAMLRFVYTDAIPEVDDEEEDEGYSKVGMAQHLLVAADRYGLPRLKAMCEATLLEHIDTSAVATTLTLAEQHGCHGLKEGCFRFMRAPGNTKAVMASEGFQHLRTSCPFLIEEMLAKLAP